MTNIVLSVRGTERLSYEKRIDCTTTTKAEARESDTNPSHDRPLEAGGFTMSEGEKRSFEVPLTIPEDASSCGPVFGSPA